MAQICSLKQKVKAYVYHASGCLSHKDFVTVWTQMTRCFHYEPQYQITQPLLLTHGDHDVFGNFQRTMPLWAARDPQSHYVVIPGAGHCANQDNPDFFNKLLPGFLQKHIP